MVELLLAGGAVPDRRVADEQLVLYGWKTPLLYAVGQGNETMVRLLLENGADANVLHSEPRYGPPEQSMALHIAARDGNLHLVRLLLDHGADVNKGISRGAFFAVKWTPGARGWTALHAAAERGHIDVAKRLIHRGADVNARTIAGNTPLDFAKQHSHTKVAQYLIDHGARQR